MKHFFRINKVHSLTSLLVFAISAQGFDPKKASLEMVAGVCATQVNLGTVPSAPEKAGWHKQTGVGEEDKEDLEELPPEAFIDSDESADEDFLDDPDFYSLLDEQGSFWDVGGGGDSTMGTPSQHEATELVCRRQSRGRSGTCESSTTACSCCTRPRSFRQLDLLASRPSAGPAPTSACCSMHSARCMSRT